MQEAKKFKKKKKKKGLDYGWGILNLLPGHLKICKCEFLALHSAPYLWA